MKQLKKLLLIIPTSLGLLLILVFLESYNSPEKIEKRCTFKFQKELKKGEGKSDMEWNLIIDKADHNYLKCINIL